MRTSESEVVPIKDPQVTQTTILAGLGSESQGKEPHTQEPQKAKELKTKKAVKEPGDKDQEPKKEATGESMVSTNPNVPEKAEIKEKPGEGQKKKDKPIKDPEEQKDGSWKLTEAERRTTRRARKAKIKKARRKSQRNKRPSSLRQQKKRSNLSVKRTKAAVIQNNMIGTGTEIKENATVQRNMIGRNCKIGKDCKIINSVIMDNCTIGDK